MRTLLLIVGLTPLLGGCTTIGYLSQAVGGHLRILEKRQPIAEVLRRDDLEPDLRRKLVLAQQVRAFATEHLGLGNKWKLYDLCGYRTPFCYLERRRDPALFGHPPALVFSACRLL